MAAVVPLLEKLEGIPLDLDEIPKTVLGDSCKASSGMRELQVSGCLLRTEISSFRAFYFPSLWELA